MQRLISWESRVSGLRGPGACQDFQLTVGGNGEGGHPGVLQVRCLAVTGGGIADTPHVRREGE